MTKKKKKDKERKEIRIVTTDMQLFDKVENLSVTNKRSVGKEAEYMVANYIIEHNL